MKSALPIVNELHAEYCTRTGFEIELNYARERQWGEWLSWRPGKPFTVEDLRRVIAYIRQGIHKGERNDGALKFSNLIGSPDRFEADLGLALKAIKTPAGGPQKGTYKPIMPPAPEDRADPSEFAEFAQKFGRRRSP